MISRLRARFPLLDHLVRAVGRYQADTGDRLAAAVTFYWFLSLFPMLLLAIWVFSLVNGDSAVSDVRQGLAGYLPSQLVDTISTTIGTNAGKAGLLGAVGLLLSGLGWIDALREAIRSVWHQNVKAGNIVVRKSADVLALSGLIVTIGASVFVTGILGNGPAWLLAQLGVSHTAGAVAFTYVLGLLLAGVADVALFLYLFLRLARVPSPFRQVVKGALFGAVGFAVLKLVGGYYVQRTTSKGEATYGTFAVVVGLLLFLNLLSRLVLLAAAFAVTGPGDSDVRPSGTADPDQARKAGIPDQYVDTDLQEDGAPTPLVAALQADPEQAARPAAAGAVRSSGAAGDAVPGEVGVRRAARFTTAVLAAVLAAVGFYALRTLVTTPLRLLRRAA
ncbi:MAG: YihY/virulence factor BrkB family protein [Mycobacteriales bacterium]